MNRPFLLAALAAALLALPAPPARAHAIRVFATMEADGTLHGYAYAPGGTRIAGQPVFLEDGEGEKISTDQTAPDGTFRFPAPPAAARLVVVELPDGHRGQFRLPRSITPPGPPPPAAPDPTAALHARIATLEGEVRFRDVVGGIGYIVGLFGLLAWRQSRRPATRSDAP